MGAGHTSPPSATPPATEQPASLPPSGKRFRKRIYVVLGIVAVVAVASALVFVFLNPLNAGVTIPLSYNFTQGEKMTYNVTAIATNAMGENMSTKETISMDIISFDGENYTINQTTTLSLSGGSPMSFSVTEKMNKTGYVTYLNDSIGMQQMSFMFGNIGSLHQKDEAKAGETWQVPMNWGNSSYGFNGTLTLKFGDIQNITVPAGTYKVFKIDLSGSNLTMVFSTPPPVNVSISENITVNGQMYLEYGTCRLVDADFQGNVSILQDNQTSTQTFSEEMKLVKHVKP